MGPLTNLAVFAVMLAITAHFFFERNTISDGTIPLWHWTARHNYAASELPDLSGRVAVVTGASSGLGLATARHLVRANATVVATARTEAKCKATVEALRRVVVVRDDSRVDCVELELLSLAQTAAATQKILAAYPRIDLIVLNAGIMAPPSLALSNDDVEAQFQTNHLAHHLLATRLSEALMTRPGGRLVAVSSVAHWFAPEVDLLDLSSLGDADEYRPVQWYGWSKLCNVLFAREFARRYHVPAHSVHPGGVRGNLLSKFSFPKVPRSFLAAFENAVYWSADTAALTVLKPLVDPTCCADATHSLYFVPVGRQRPPAIRAQNDHLAAALWNFSEAIIEDKLGAAIHPDASDSDSDKNCDAQSCPTAMS